MAVPPVFVSGQVLTAAQMNQIGLWEIKSQTIGTGVSSVVVTNAFSSDFDNYLITVNGGAASTTARLTMVLGSTITGYYYAVNSRAYNSGTLNAAQAQNATSWAYMGRATANSVNAFITICDPFNTEYTIFTIQSAGAGSVDEWLSGGGYIDNTTSYTDFTIAPNTGTLTGGTIRVYGYRN